MNVSSATHNLTALIDGLQVKVCFSASTHQYQREGGDNGLIITLVTKVLLFVGLTTFIK